MPMIDGHFVYRSDFREMFENDEIPENAEVRPSESDWSTMHGLWRNFHSGLIVTMPEVFSLIANHPVLGPRLTQLEMITEDIGNMY